MICRVMTTEIWVPKQQILPNVYKPIQILRQMKKSKNFRKLSSNLRLRERSWSASKSRKYTKKIVWFGGNLELSWIKFSWQTELFRTFLESFQNFITAWINPGLRFAPVKNACFSLLQVQNFVQTVGWLTATAECKHQDSHFSVKTGIQSR